MSQTLDRDENLSPLKQAFLALERSQAQLAALERAQREPIAIVGMGCRLPGSVHNPAEFWELLASGRDGITEVPANRWDLNAFYDPRPDAAGKMVTRCGGFVDEVERFDAQFFGISPREALTLDPQQRLLLEVGYEALEDAAMAPDSLSGSRGGVFVGICGIDYSKRITRRDPELIDAYIGTGNGHSVAAGRLSYYFGLQGPSVAIDTACSSSLVALHWACQSLRGGECDFALAGGVNLLLDPELSINFSQAHMLAPDGRCKTFDAAADGYVRGEGAGLVVVQRLADALSAGARIVAVIRGSAVNQDGPSSGLTVPNGPAQQDVIRQALAHAGARPDEIDYVEAHGTGTALGDPIELGALGEVFRGRASPLWVGSAKTNIGHLEATAGVAGLLKVVLALQHQEIPPHLHFHQPNARVLWDQLPIQIPTQPTPWRSGARRRLAGLSSFAFNGTNSHVVVEEAPAQDQQQKPERPCHLLPLSAKCPEALGALARRYQEQLQSARPPILRDVCYTAATGRAHHAQRLALVAETGAEARERLQEYLAGAGADGIAAAATESEAPSVAFLFSGQGSQYPGMGRQLVDTEPTCREAFQQCEEILRDHLQRPLREVVFPENQDASLLNETGYTQPALFALEYALARLWMSWGIAPQAAIGHSVGEYVAACLAGVFSLEDGLRLISTRARLMQELPQNGRMVAVLSDHCRVAEALTGCEDTVAIAAVNGPCQVVISGLAEAVERITAKLNQDGITTHRLDVSHAFHSPLMEPILEPFRDAAATVRYARPRWKLISNLTGRWVDEEIARPDYWVEHIRRPVRFADGIATLSSDNVDACLEVGPQSTLLGLARACCQSDGGAAVTRWLGSLHPKQADWHCLLSSLAALYVDGHPVDWKGYARGFAGRNTRLPTYPFQRERYWLEPAGFVASTPATSGVAVHPLLGHRTYSATARDCVQFDGRLSADNPGYLTDHRVWDTVFFPGTGFLEMALAAGRQLFPRATVVVEDVSFERPIKLPDGKMQIIQTAMVPEPGGHRCELYGYPASAADEQPAPDWTRHAQGRIAVDDDQTIPVAVDLDDLKSRYPHSVCPDALYERLRHEALHYGPCFQALKDLRYGQREAVGRVQLPQANRQEAEQYLLHPALLDCCLHVMAGVAMGEEGGAEEISPFLPVGLERLRVFQPAGAEVWSHAKIFGDGEFRHATAFTADLVLYSPAGQPVAVLEGLRMQRVPRSSLMEIQEEKPNDWMYDVRWRAAPAAGDPASDMPDTWLLLADAEGVAEELARKLTTDGCTCTLVRPAERYEVLESAADASRCYLIRPDAEDDFSRVLEEVSAQRGENGQQTQTPLGIMHLWSVGMPDAGDDAFASSQRLSCGTVLSLVQALSAGAVDARLWLVTRGAQAVDQSPTTVAQLAQAPLWGLARVVAMEHPGLRCLRVDLDPGDDRGADADTLMAELTHVDNEDQVAYRHASRYAARLVRLEKTPTAGLSVPDEPYRLRLTALDSVDNVTAVPRRRRPPGRDEVEIEVAAAGLNFRDALRALGMLKEIDKEVGQRLGISSPQDAPLGFECAGRVAAMGAGVDHLSAGDEVLAIAYGSLASHVTARAGWVIRKPPSLSMIQAAAVPMAFVTAAYALERLAQLKPGERVLIHAAAGGVGQAAVQVAQTIGAEIFATASPGKWEFLQAQGIDHVMNSRTLDFEQEVMRLTGGKGVDVVLNSLTGEFIPANLNVLGPAGRFVEIGKLDIWDAQRVAAQRGDVRYFPFDLDQEENRQPGLIQSLLTGLMSRFSAGQLQPPPHQVFPVQQVRAALRHLTQLQRVGKVVVAIATKEIRNSCAGLVEMRGAATYLITGGLGGLGLRVAQSLVERGARHLVLSSRSDIGMPEQTDALRQMREAGAEVRVIPADVSRRRDVECLLETIRTDLPPLRGVVHAAGLLDDGMLRLQNWDRFERVLRPKIAGAWHLHRLTEDLDFFVLFSSGVGLVGAYGQSSYAAANAFLDALAHYRRASGLPAVSIAWGPWADLGMTARISAQSRQRMAEVGLVPIAPTDGLKAFGVLLQAELPLVAAMRVDWAQLATVLPPAPLWAELARTSSFADSGPSTIMEQLRSLPPADARERLVEHLRGEVAAVLAWKSSARIGPRQKFFDLGMDSLTSVELRQRLERSLGCALPLTVAFDYPNVEALAEYVALQVHLFEEDSTPTTRPAQGSDAQAARLAQMSDAEVEALLVKKVKELM